MTILAPFDRKIPTPEDMKFEFKEEFFWTSFIFQMCKFWNNNQIWLCP